MHVALGTELPLNQGLSTYYPNLHRDWCWGDAENRASLAAVQASLPAGVAPQRILVVGAGAGRLAAGRQQQAESWLRDLVRTEFGRRGEQVAGVLIRVAAGEAPFGVASGLLARMEVGLRSE